MGRIAGIGETIVDILFREGRPEGAVPGGSVFNAMVSLSRMGMETAFVGEAGSDEVGNLVTAFMSENGMSQDYVVRYEKPPSPISLAFLDERNDAHYVFYKQRPKGLPIGELPAVGREDALLFGSFYALEDDTRRRMEPLLEQAQKAGAFVYYDPNFRSSHLDERERVMPHVLSNMQAATVVRGSDEDFGLLFEGRATDKRQPFGERATRLERLYEESLKRHTAYVICTCGAEGALLFTPHLRKHYAAPKVETVSTVGAGDNFNAGFLYGLMKEKAADGIRTADWDEVLQQMGERVWERCIEWGLRFASDVCSQTGNHVSPAFVSKHRE